MTRRVVVLDRDGTINIDRHYISDPAQLEFLPRAAAGLERLHADGSKLVIITNQSGVGRGYFTLEQLERVHARLREMFAALGVPIAGLYFCPHRPDEDCACRKPKAGLMQRAARELGFEPNDAVVIGDKQTDVEFGKSCGAKTILISAERPSAVTSADFIAADLYDAAIWINHLQRRELAS